VNVLEVVNPRALNGKNLVGLWFLDGHGSV